MMLQSAYLHSKQYTYCFVYDFYGDAPVTHTCLTRQPRSIRVPRGTVEVLESGECSSGTLGLSQDVDASF